MSRGLGSFGLVRRILGASPEVLVGGYGRHAMLLERVAQRTSPDLAHDLQHVMRVYRWAIRLAPEAKASPDLCGAAALVHDLVSVPKHLATRPLGGERSAAAAAGLLPEAGYSLHETTVVVDAVATHSWSRGLPPRSSVGVVLQDADRIDALGAVGMLRNAAVAEAMAQARLDRLNDPPAAFCHPVDPMAQSGRPLNDSRYALDHWRVKLLKLRDGMHLPAARVEAARRHAWMMAALAQLTTELPIQTPALADNPGSVG